MTLVRDLMHRPVITVAPTDLVRDARARAQRHEILHLPVVREGYLVGILSMSDLAGANAEAPVSTYMSTLVATIGPDDPASLAADLMAAADVHCLPVGARWRVEGIITGGDLRRAKLLP